MQALYRADPMDSLDKVGNSVTHKGTYRLSWAATANNPSGEATSEEVQLFVDDKPVSNPILLNAGIHPIFLASSAEISVESRFTAELRPVSAGVLKLTNAQGKLDPVVLGEEMEKLLPKLPPSPAKLPVKPPAKPPTRPSSPSKKPARRFKSFRATMADKAAAQAAEEEKDEVEEPLTLERVMSHADFRPPAASPTRRANLRPARSNALGRSQLDSFVKVRRSTAPGSK
jgi:hypothetical protein